MRPVDSRNGSILLRNMGQQSYYPKPMMIVLDCSLSDFRPHLAAFVLLCGAGCGPNDSAPPVAMPAVALNRNAVPIGGPLEMSYRFTPAVDGLGADGDYRVFVHFLDADGELMFEDDHAPPEPTLTWRSGQSVGYNRRMLVPIYPYIGPVTVAIGLYSPGTGERLPLMGDGLGQRAYEVASFRMAPQSESGFLMFEDGWHSAESSVLDPTQEWRWSTAESTIVFRNPEVDSTLYLDVQGRPEWFETPQVLSLQIGDATVDTVELLSDGRSYYAIPIGATAFGSDEMVTLSVNVDQTFVPSVVTDGENPDDRELGVQLFYAFLETS